MDSAATWVTRSRTLHPGWPGSPCDWGSHIAQIPLKRTGESSSTALMGCSSTGVCVSHAGCSPGRPGAGDSCWAHRQPPTHPQCLQCSQLLPGCITKVPVAAGRARAVFYKFVCYGTASTGTLLWHPEHFAEWFGSTLLTRQHISRFRL